MSMFYYILGFTIPLLVAKLRETGNYDCSSWKYNFVSTNKLKMRQ
jgi:hypothetical protein